MGAPLPAGRGRARRRRRAHRPAGPAARDDRGRRPRPGRRPGRRRRPGGPPRTSGWTTAARRPRWTPPVDALWRDRLVPFEENLRHAPAAPRPVDAGRARTRGWAADGARLAARLAAAAGDRGRAVAHVGPTAVPGTAGRGRPRPAAGRGEPADVGGAAGALAAAGFPARPGPAARRAARVGRPRAPGPGRRAPDRLARVAQRVAAPGLAAGRRARHDRPATGATSAAGYPERGRSWAASSGWRPPIR